MSNLAPKSKQQGAATVSWQLIDAQGKRVGQVATRAAHLLRGKASPDFSPWKLPLVHVVVINASLIDLPVRRAAELQYRHSGYLGNLKTTTRGKRVASQPEAYLTHAILGMLPRNRLRRAIATHLHIYPGDAHRHPEALFA